MAAFQHRNSFRSRFRVAPFSRNRKDNPVPHFPKPFFRASRKLWYVQLNGRQINLGSDKDEAFKKYHKLLASPEQAAETVTQSDEMLVVQLFDQFLCWVEKHRAPATYGWYLPRIQSFVSAYLFGQSSAR